MILNGCVSRLRTGLTKTLTFLQKHLFSVKKKWMCLLPPKQLVQQFVRNTDEISSKTWAFDHTPGSERRFEKIHDFHVTIWVFPKIEVPQNGWWKDGKPNQNGWFGDLGGFYPWVEGKTNNDPPFQKEVTTALQIQTSGGSTKNVNSLEKMWPNKLKMH